MADIYLDEDLTTGAQDGTSWADAYRTWAAMVTGEATTLTEDTNIYIRSTGTVSVQRDLLATDGWNVSTYILSLIGDTANIPTLYFSNAFGIILETDLDNIEIENIIFDGADACLQISGSANNITNCVFMNANNRGVYKAGDTGSGAVATLRNCIAVNCVSGFYVQDFRYMTCINCYAGNNTNDYVPQSGNAVLTLTTSASSDTSGSAGLQSIPYSTSTFTNVTAGTEDFHLVSGSSLIDAGTVTSYTTDQEGTIWSTPREIGVFNYVSSGSSIPVFMRHYRNMRAN